MSEVIANENPGLMDASAGVKLVSGFGQYHTNRDREIHGRFYPGKPYSGITLAEIFEMAKNPPSVPKAEAQWVIFSSLPSRVHTEQRERGTFYALWADFDQVHCTLAELHQKAVAAIGADCLVYTSRSATEDHHKARLIIPLAEPCNGETFVLLQRILNDQLQAYGLIPDRATERAGQVCYLPNRGEYYDWLANDDAGPLDWQNDLADALEAEIQRQREQEALHEAKMEQARLKARQRMETGQASPIDAFNAAYPVELMFEQYGYRQTTPGRWLSPNSESGSPGVTVKGRRWLSAHESDAHIGQQTANGAAGDAFDLFVAYEHQGDRNAALRAAGELFTTPEGVSLTKQNQRSYMQAKAADMPMVEISLSSQSGDVVEYPEPQPIPDDLLPVAAFDNDLLPDAIRPWVADIADRMQCPPDFPAVAAMVALSSIIGRKVCIQPKRQDDWQVMPNLWGAVVGRPGVMKSPALSEAIKPLDRLAIAAKEQYESDRKDYEIQRQLSEMTVKSAQKQAEACVKKGNLLAAEQILRDATEGDADTGPTLRRYKVTDATVEALGEILIENPNGVLAYRDELHGLLTSLDREGQEGARSFYLQAYDGNQAYTFDRILRGRYLHIPAVCLAMLGGIQPGKLQSYINDAVRGGAGDDGLLQRFGMLVWPDISGEWRNVDRWPDTDAKTAAYQVFQRLEAMRPDADPETGEDQPTVFRFSPDAQELFESWRHGFENELRSGENHPALESHLAKYRKLVPALALVCALADGEREVVSITSTARALAWAEYLRTHAERVYAAGIKPSARGARALLDKIRAGAVGDNFKARDVYLKGWSNLSTPEQVHAAAEMLVDLNHLFAEEHRTSPAGGRPTTRYTINPATLREVK